MAKKPEKKTPQRAAAGGKGKQPSAEKAAKVLASAVVGANVTDDALDKFIRKYWLLQGDLAEAMEPAKEIRGKIGALNKEMTALGIKPKGFKLAYEVHKLAEDGPAVVAWYVRIAKRKSLPGSGMQLDLLDPAKNQKTQAPLVDADAVVEKASAAAGAANGKGSGSTNGANGSTAHGQSRNEQLKDLEENGFHQGVAAKPGGLKIPKGLEGDEGAVKALQSGYERGQKKNMAGITAPKKTISRGALKGRFN